MSTRTAKGGAGGVARTPTKPGKPVDDPIRRAGIALVEDLALAIAFEAGDISLFA
jgi:hypothetical protein